LSFALPPQWRVCSGCGGCAPRGRRSSIWWAVSARPTRKAPPAPEGGAELFVDTLDDDSNGWALPEREGESNHPDEVEQVEAHLTPEQIAEDRQMVSQNSEGIDLFTSFDQVQAKPELPSVPLVVVTAGRTDGWPPGVRGREWARGAGASARSPCGAGRSLHRPECLVDKEVLRSVGSGFVSGVGSRVVLCPRCSIRR